jgi:hypothetical protein
MKKNTFKTMKHCKKEKYIGQGWACGYYSLDEAATAITLPVLGGVKKIMHRPIMYQI